MWEGITHCRHLYGHQPDNSRHPFMTFEMDEHCARTLAVVESGANYRTHVDGNYVSVSTITAASSKLTLRLVYPSTSLRQRRSRSRKWRESAVGSLWDSRGSLWDSRGSPEKLFN